MRYVIAFLLLLMTAKGATMVMEAVINLQSDYVTVPLFASSEIEGMGAEAYVSNLMAKHQEYLSSMLFGAAVLLASVSFWLSWYRRYFAKVTNK